MYSFIEALWSRIGIGWLDVAAVAIATATMYAALVVLVRLLGQRTLARMGGFDVAAVIALGSIAGRASLGYTPTMAAGVVSLVTLFVTEAIFGELRRAKLLARALENRGVVLLADGVVLADMVRRAHLIEDELFAGLRRAGLQCTDDAALVILESTGELSVLRRGKPIERRLIHGVRGAERIPGHLLAGT